MISVAAELSRRGVPDLWFACDPSRRDEIEAAATGTPLRFIPFACGPTRSEVDDFILEEKKVGPRDLSGLAHWISQLRHFEHRYAEYRDFLGIIDRIRPALMVVDTMTLAPLDAAMTRGIPFAVTLPAMPSFGFTLPWLYPSPIAYLPRRMNARQHLSNAVFKMRSSLTLLTRTPTVAFAVKRRILGIKNASGSHDAYYRAAQLVLTSSVFGLEYAFPVPPHTHLVGAFLPENPPDRIEDPDLLEWLDRAASVVYLGFGTLSRLSRDQIRALLTAVQRLGPAHQFLWKLSKEQQDLLPPPESRPGNLRVESWIPSQLSVLAHPHVRVFVTHGGSNGFHESVHYGKPVLVLPAWLDCYAIAHRAVDSGVGLAVGRPAEVTGDELTAKLTRLLTEDSFHRSAGHWSQRLRAAGGVTRAADLLLELRAGLPGAASDTAPDSP
ncbi:glycosyltransferase [Streptomyces paludis]|uniref:glycosyltransferase n=1 Tax=Streptomyces paludis TaxID=2282738 RepID=UPI0013B3A881|nr:glycosyltransferase [Streptomyces paludis]